MTPNPADPRQGDRLAGEDKHMNEPMSSITPEAVERLNTFAGYLERGEITGQTTLPDDLRSLLSVLQSKDREIARLREALGPFARFDLGGFDGVVLEVVPSSPDNPSRRIEPILKHYFEDARQALSTTQDEGGE